MGRQPAAAARRSRHHCHHDRDRRAKRGSQPQASAAYHGGRRRQSGRPVGRCAHRRIRQPGVDAALRTFSTGRILVRLRRILPCRHGVYRGHRDERGSEGPEALDPERDHPGRDHRHPRLPVHHGPAVGHHPGRRGHARLAQPRCSPRVDQDRRARILVRLPGDVGGYPVFGIRQRPGWSTRAPGARERRSRAPRAGANESNRTADHRHLGHGGHRARGRVVGQSQRGRALGHHLLPDALRDDQPGSSGREPGQGPLVPTDHPSPVVRLARRQRRGHRGDVPGQPLGMHRSRGSGNAALPVSAA